MWKSLAAPIALLAGPALADPPRVVTDIPPVQSIVSAVMGDLGTPAMLLPPQADPHHYQMRPSQTRALAQADILVWMGEAMTPWLGDALPGVNASAVSLELLELEGLPMVVVFGEGDDDSHDDHGEHDDENGHDDHGEHDDENGHDDHGDHDDEDGHDEKEHDNHADDDDGHEDHDGKEHDDHAGDGHDDHAEDDHSEDGHADHGHHHHDGVDPHAWMDPLNGAAFALAIADALAAADPDNAATYMANAEAAAARYTALQDSVHETLHPVEDAVLLPYHEAYTYFFRRFGLKEIGGLADFEGMAPGAARLAELIALMADAPHACVFMEPGGNAQLPATVAPDAPVPGTLYPLGSNLEVGAELYPGLITQIAETLAACAKS